MQHILYAMLHTELLHALALLKVEGIGDVVAKKLITTLWFCLRQFFTSKKKTLLAIDGVGEMLYKKMQDPSVFQS